MRNYAQRAARTLLDANQERSIALRCAKAGFARAELSVQYAMFNLGGAAKLHARGNAINCHGHGNRDGSQAKTAYTAEHHSDVLYLPTVNIAAIDATWHLVAHSALAWRRLP